MRRFWWPHPSISHDIIGVGSTIFHLEIQKRLFICSRFIICQKFVLHLLSPTFHTFLALTPVNTHARSISCMFYFGPAVSEWGASNNRVLVEDSPLWETMVASIWFDGDYHRWSPTRCLPPLHRWRCCGTSVNREVSKKRGQNNAVFYQEFDFIQFLRTCSGKWYLYKCSLKIDDWQIWII